MHARRAALLLVVLAPSLAGAQDAYVPNQGSNNLTILDAATLDVITTLPLGNQPHEGIATRDARHVFVSNRLDDTLSVFDASTRTEIDTDGNALNGLTRIAVGSRPHGLALTPDDRFLFVANDSSGDLTVVDTATFQVVSTVPAVGFAPHMVAITPDGKEAWTGNITGGDVSVVDVAAALVDPLNAVVCVGPVLCRIPAGAGTEGIAFTKDGRTAYAANGGANTVTVIDTASRAVISTIPVAGGPRRVHVTPDGSRAYVSQLFGTTLVAIDTSTQLVVAADGFTGVSNVLGMDFSADGRFLYAANFFSATITVLDRTGVDEPATVGVGANPDSVILLPEEVRNVRLDASGATLSWDRNYQAAAYHVYRGEAGDLPDYGTCLGGSPTTSLVDGDAPARGTAFFYLVSVDLGAREGILGRDGHGGLRVPAASCS